MTPPASSPPDPRLIDTDAAKLSLRQVSKSFRGARGPVLALDNVSLTVSEASVVCLLGPSGCGKSTLLNLIAGLDHPDSGEVLVDGGAVTGPGRDRMVLFQEHALFPWLNAIDNVLFGLRLKPGLSDRERQDVARFFLRLVGLEAFAKAWVHELSGGMRQRIALARALAPNPRILLMDEPFAALDALTREGLYADLQRIQRERHKTIVFVTHDVRESVCLGDRVVLLSPHPGRVREEFEIALPRPRDPNDPRVATLAAHITSALRATLPAD